MTSSPSWSTLPHRHRSSGSDRPSSSGSSWREAMTSLASARDELRELDAAIGDGDLGITVSSGARAVGEALAAGPPATIADVLRTAARAFARANPSTMSGLIASALLAAARVLDGQADLDRDGAVRLLEVAITAMTQRGGAELGDKTVLDAVQPAWTRCGPPPARQSAAPGRDDRGGRAAGVGGHDVHPGPARARRMARRSERRSRRRRGSRRTSASCEALAAAWPRLSAAPGPILRRSSLKTPTNDHLTCKGAPPVIQRPNLRLDTPAPWLGVNFWSRRGGPLMWRTYDDALVREELGVLVAPRPERDPLVLLLAGFPARAGHDRRGCRGQVPAVPPGVTRISVSRPSRRSSSGTCPAGTGNRPGAMTAGYYADGFMLGQQAFFIREMVRRMSAVARPRRAG